MARRTTKNCWSCSKETDSDSKYCPKCGAILDTSACYPKPDKKKESTPTRSSNDTDRDSYEPRSQNGRWGKDPDDISPIHCP